MSQGNIVIAADRLYKSYKKVQAVKNFSIDVRRGEMIGLLGDDGAGKTTALQLLAGVLAPTSGTVRRQTREDGLGYMSEGFSLYPTLSVEENVDFFAAIHKVPGAARQSLKRELLCRPADWMSQAVARPKISRAACRKNLRWRAR